MRWISVGQEAEGVIAIGQVATGVFAFGQMATGVVAVGQAARGFIAVGQVAIGVFAVGMGSVGLVYSVGMFGAGGRGLGFILPLVPSLGPKLALPETTPAARLFSGKARHGYVAATLDGGSGRPTLSADGRALEVRFDTRLRGAIDAVQAPMRVHARLSRAGDGWVCDELQEVPRARWLSPGWWAWWAAQLVGLGVACVAFWLLAGIPIVQALFNPGGILVSP